MKKIWVRNGLMFLMALALSFPAFTVSAEANTGPFTNAIKSQFVDYLAGHGLHSNEYEGYNRYAIHDFDGDGVPEVMMGLANPRDPRVVGYDVFKYSNGRFVRIGFIQESRYLMKDKFSHAILSVYHSKGTATPGVPALDIENIYVHNATLHTNGVLSHNGYNQFTSGPMPRPNINQTTYLNELYNYLGSYDELIVHDSFNISVILACVYSWRPEVKASPHTLPLVNPQSLTRNWQIAYYTFLEDLFGAPPGEGPPEGPSDLYFADYENFYRRDNKVYTRYALHDLTGNGVPELLLAVNRGVKMSLDVYTYRGGEVMFMGSFDGYSKYISKFSGSNDIFSYDPIWDQMNIQTATRVSYANNAIGLRIIMSIYNRVSDGRDVFSVDGSITSQSAYNQRLINYIDSTLEIKTYDMVMTPYSAVLARWRPARN